MWPQRRKQTKQTFFSIVPWAVPQSAVCLQKQNVFYFVRGSGTEGQETEGLQLFYSTVWIPFWCINFQISPQNPVHYTWINLGTYPGQPRSLLTSSFRRNSPGPGSRASWPPPVARSLIPSFHRENKKKVSFFFSPSSVCSLASSQHLDLAALSLFK